MARIEYRRPANLTLEEVDKSLRSIVSQLNKSLSRIGARGGSTTTSIIQTLLGSSQVVSFQIPPIAETRLEVTTAGIPAFHNIASITGAGMSGILAQSVVGGIARITALSSGYVSLTWEDEAEILSTNVGTGYDGEFVWAITQYDKNNTDLRSWIGDHGISDPVITGRGFKFPFSKTTGIVPVNEGDYFTFNFAFNVNQANKYLRFSLPADNPGLDERIELIYFPTASLTNQGPKGDPGPKGSSFDFGTTFPLTPTPRPGDVFTFTADVSSGLVWKDTDGTTDLASAKKGDMAKRVGTNWVKQILKLDPEQSLRGDLIVDTVVFPTSFTTPYFTRVRNNGAGNIRPFEGKTAQVTGYSVLGNRNGVQFDFDTLKDKPRLIGLLVEAVAGTPQTVRDRQFIGFGAGVNFDSNRLVPSLPFPHPNNIIFTRSFPSSPASGDGIIFDRNVSGLTNYYDSETGGTALTTASQFEVARYNGTRWVKQNSYYPIQYLQFQYPMTYLMKFDNNQAMFVVYSERRGGSVQLQIFQADNTLPANAQLKFYEANI